MKTWLDCGRDDLHGIPFMESHGFTPVFSYKDQQNGRTKPTCLPHDSVSFRKNNIQCFKTVDQKTIHGRADSIVYNWQVSICVDGTNWGKQNIRFDTLDEIIKYYL